MTLAPKSRLIAGFALIVILGVVLVWKHAHDKSIGNQGTGVSSVAPGGESNRSSGSSIQPDRDIQNHNSNNENKIIKAHQPDRRKQEKDVQSNENSSDRFAPPRSQQLASSDHSGLPGSTEESDIVRQQAEKEKAELRAQLLQQLNTILATRDTARGLIANMSDVLFKTGSYELSPGARERLAKASGIILAHPGLHIEIEGHTDSLGSEEYNQQLSEKRAAAVREYLVQQGIPPSVIVVRGLGKTQPVASNDALEGRQQNRRVELILSGDAIDFNTHTAAAPK
jgi:outer membrane protein OmpA-like peptidoglycan-associated protein